MYKFTSLDYAIVIAYLVVSIYIGVRVSRSQKSLTTYFLAERSAPWWAVGVSVVAANLSAISYMGSPAWIFDHDLQLDFATILFPFICLFVVVVFVPFLARLRLFTVYEYLEKRFNTVVRTCASGFFLLVRGGWLATALYAQSLVLREFTGLSLIACILIVGGGTAVYTVMGGMKAVLWTDFMQFFVLAGGLVAIVGAVLFSFHGSVGDIWRIVSEGGHTKFINPEFSLTTETTVWGVLIGFSVMNLSTYSSDQMIVQRYLTTKSRKEMTRAIMLNGWITVGIVAMLSITGLSLVAYYAMHPELRATLANTQQVIPHFIQYVLPPGLSGLVIAGIFAATMSSVSAGFNSLSTATMIDFIKKFKRGESWSARTDLWSARMVTVVWAVFVTVGAMFVNNLGGIIQIIGKINGFFMGPLLGLFLLGILTKRANSTGALTGIILGTAATWWASTKGVSWLWYSPIGCIATMLTGYLVSLVQSRAVIEDKLLHLTIWGSNLPEQQPAEE